MSNASILERNITHGFEALGGLGAIVEDAFWRFRNAHEPLCAERMAYQMATHTALVDLSVRVCLPMLPGEREQGEDWRVLIELNYFLRERLHHHDGSCSCAAPFPPQKQNKGDA